MSEEIKVSSTEVVEDITEVEGLESVQDDDTTEDVETSDEETSVEEDGDEDGETEEEEDSSPKKLTAEERKAQLQKEIQDLANQRKVLKETLEKEMEEKINEKLKQVEEDKPNFVQVDWEKINSYVASEMEAIDQLKFDGKAAEALLRQRNLDKLYNDIEENEEKRKQWESKRAEKENEKNSIEQVNQAILKASELVRQAKNISEEDWKLGEQWFLEKRRSDPLLDTTYREKVFNQGPAHALNWATDYVVKNMGKPAKEAKEKKEEAKKKLVGGISSGESSSKTPSSFDDLMKMSDAEVEKFEKNNPKLFNKLIRQKMK